MDRDRGAAGVLVLLLLVFALAPPAAAQVAVGGVMRFAAADVAFLGGFGGVAVDVWRVEPYGYVSQDAGVWAIQAGVAAPVVRREMVRVSIRLGTSTAIAGPAVEPNVHPTVGWGAGRRAVRGAGRGGPREGVHAAAGRRVRRLVEVCSRCPPSPGGSSRSRMRSGSSKALDRDLLTRRDVEKLLGVSRARAAQLMRTFGAELTGYARVLPRAQLLRQLRKYRRQASFRNEEQRRTRVVAELRTARLSGIRVAVPVEALEARLAGLPEGVSVEADRIEVRFGSAREAVGKLFALAQALTSDYERFEALVGKGERSSR